MSPRIPLFVCSLLLASAAFAQQADLTLKVTPIGPGIAPWPTRFEFTVTNNGPDRATNVRLESPDDIDPLSEWANPTCARQSGDVRWRCTADVIEPGQSAQFAGNIGPAPATQPYTFHFSVRADQADPNLADNDIPVTIDWADPGDVSVDFIPPDPLGTSRTGRLVIDNRSEWPMDYIQFELSFYNTKRLVSMTPAVQCRDAWPEPLDKLIWLNCEMRGIPAKSKQEIAFEFELPEQAVDFNVKVTWWLFTWSDREGAVYARPFYVTNTANAGPGSLRQALLDANAQCSAAADITCRVVFAIDEPVPERGWFTIQPTEPLPEIHAEWLSIDGFTQRRKSGDTNMLGPDIELDGRLLQTGDGLVFFSNYSEVHGLAIGGFPRHGILIERESQYHRDLSHQSFIKHNYIGIDPTGREARPNGSRGVMVNRGHGWLEGNVLSGNARSGAFFDSQSAVVISNRIGVAAFDDTPVPNGASGLFIGQRTAGYGSASVERNTIAHNREFGIALAPAAFTIVRDNRMFANGNSGIDIGLDGPTLESSSYTAPPAPVITAAYFDGMTTTITGHVTELPGSISAKAYSVDVYANDDTDANGFAQGERYLGQVAVAPDGAFTFIHGGDLRGKWINATGTFGINFFYEYTVSTSSELSRAIRVPD